MIKNSGKTYKNDYICSPKNVSVAQLVEQLTLNQRVDGSNPSGDTEKEALGRVKPPGAFLLWVKVSA
jgi:hypothetical protein